MGVHQLWHILEPVRRKENLSTLSNKTLCVDLSGWICEAKCAKGLKENVSKPHLRNLFFRLLYLTRLGVKLVFVVDGKPPELKWDAITKRTQARNGGRNWRSKNSQKSGSGARVGRSHFAFWVTECRTLLNLLGIPCIESTGEAEALCAWLDLHQIVDGCITNDGDAFLYGARTVYKDLCISGKDASVECYRMEEIESELNLSRQNLVALGVLLGCDYLPQGVSGVGKEIAMKLIRNVNYDNLIDRFYEWTKGMCQDENLSSVEKSVKCKALKDKNFPHPKVIQEFLNPEVLPQNVSLRIMSPDLRGLQEFCLKNLEWPEEYTREKVLLLLTYWQMTSSLQQHTATLVQPEKIVKARVQQKIECYEVEWQNIALGETCPPSFVTIETRELFAKVYPDLVEEFNIAEATKLSKKSKKKKADKPSTTCNDCENEMDLLSQQLKDLSVGQSCGAVHGSISHEEAGEQDVDKDESLQDIIDSILPNNAGHNSCSPPESSSPFVGMIDRNFFAASKRWQYIDSDEDDDNELVRNDDQNVHHEDDDNPCDVQPQNVVMASNSNNEHSVRDCEDDFLKCGLFKLKAKKITRSGITVDDDVLGCSQENHANDINSEERNGDGSVTNANTRPTSRISPNKTTTTKPIPRFESAAVIDLSDDDIVDPGENFRLLKKSMKVSKSKQVMLNDTDFNEIFGCSSDFWSSDDEEANASLHDASTFARKPPVCIKKRKVASQTEKLSSYNDALEHTSTKKCLNKSTKQDAHPILSYDTKFKDCRDSVFDNDGGKTVVNKGSMSDCAVDATSVMLMNDNTHYEGGAERSKIYPEAVIAKQVLLSRNSRNDTKHDNSYNRSAPLSKTGSLKTSRCDRQNNIDTHSNSDEESGKENIDSPSDDFEPAPLFRRLGQNFTAKQRLASLRSISSAKAEL